MEDLDVKMEVSDNPEEEREPVPCIVFPLPPPYGTSDNPTPEEGGEPVPRIVFALPPTYGTSFNPTPEEGGEPVPRLVLPLPPPCGTSDNPTPEEGGEPVPRMILVLPPVTPEEGGKIVFTLPPPCGRKRTMLRIFLPWQVDPLQINHSIQYSQPTVMAKKLKIAEADEYALRSVIRHQRFRKPSWSSIRYSEVKDQFQASPGFCALKPNALLSGITTDLKCNAILSRFDLTLGAILNGLMKDMMIFHEIVNNMPENMKMTVGGAFLTPESRYRQNWDALLLYVCGRRQELIQQRRELYKPPNKMLKKALYEIPPSETHLFEDEAFKYFVEQVGGIDKLFPPEQRRGTKSFKQKANQNQWYGNRRKANQNQQYGNRGKFISSKKAYRCRQD